VFLGPYTLERIRSRRGWRAACAHRASLPCS
ncbi:MAG: hypothetical protein AVDCRST_MAG80-82, partial [uncultured Rubrobacteraceae bacterium]